MINDIQFGKQARLITIQQTMPPPPTHTQWPHDLLKTERLENVKQTCLINWTSQYSFMIFYNQVYFKISYSLWLSKKKFHTSHLKWSTHTIMFFYYFNGHLLTRQGNPKKETHSTSFFQMLSCEMCANITLKITLQLQHPQSASTVLLTLQDS